MDDYSERTNRFIQREKIRRKRGMSEKEYRKREAFIVKARKQQVNKGDGCAMVLFPFIAIVAAVVYGIARMM
jgi:hypothetical protein